MPTNNASGLSRRGLFRVGAGAVAATAAAATANAQEEFDYGDWFDDVPNYDGTVDATGEDEVTVDVGAGGSGLEFEPPAVHVDPGTTVVFEWTGEGGSHNVVESETDERYESELTNVAGTTYSITFESDGISKYVCEPHVTQGMKGAVAVGDGDGLPDVEEGETDEGGADDGNGDNGNGNGNGSGDDNGEADDNGNGEEEDAGVVADEAGVEDDVLVLFALAAVLALLSPVVLVFLMARQLQNQPDDEF